MLRLGTPQRRARDPKAMWRLSKLIGRRVFHSFFSYISSPLFLLECGGVESDAFCRRLYKCSGIMRLGRSMEKKMGALDGKVAVVTGVTAGSAWLRLSGS